MCQTIDIMPAMPINNQTKLAIKNAQAAIGDFGADHEPNLGNYLPHSTTSVQIIVLSAMDEQECQRSFETAAQPWEHAELHAQRSGERQKRYIQAHGGLRIALADCTGSSPHDIVLVRSPSGRIEMRDGPGISISYAGHRSAAAINPHGPVGLDLIHVADAQPPLSLAFCGEAEMDAVAAVLKGEGRCDLAVWAAKEAAAKLTGDVGLEPEAWTVYATGGEIRVTSSHHPAIHVAFQYLDVRYLAAIARHPNLPFTWSTR